MLIKDGHDHFNNQYICCLSLQRSLYQAPAASVGIGRVGKASNSGRWPTMGALATVLMLQKHEFNPHNDAELCENRESDLGIT